MLNCSSEVVLGMNNLFIKICNLKYIWSPCNAKLLMCLHKAKRIWFIEKLPKLWMFLPFDSPDFLSSSHIFPSLLIYSISVIYLHWKSAKIQFASIGEAFRDAKFVLIYLWKPFLPSSTFSSTSRLAPFLITSTCVTAHFFRVILHVIQRKSVEEQAKYMLSLHLQLLLVIMWLKRSHPKHA